MNRYLVRKADGSVFVWTEALAKRKDLEEVYAPNPATALVKDALPKVDSISLDELESLKKADLIIFAKTRLNIDLDPALKKDAMLDIVKPALYTMTNGEATMEVPKTGDLDKPKGSRPK